jgi:hypothetical protein
LWLMNHHSQRWTTEGDDFSSTDCLCTFAGVFLIGQWCEIHHRGPKLVLLTAIVIKTGLCVVDLGGQRVPR